MYSRVHLALAFVCGFATPKFILAHFIPSFEQEINLDGKIPILPSYHLTFGNLRYEDRIKKKYKTLDD